MTYLRLFSILGVFLMSAAFTHAHATDVTVYKSPYCGCCTAWSEHMRDNGFTVTEIKREDMDTIKKEMGVPEQLESCHTAMIDGYVVEGHVPADDVKRLLKERPKAKGLSAPGMPMGSPGMEQGGMKDRYVTVLFDEDDNMSAFARH
ncbi:MAG: DUF411 domain-containing protein [Terasakiella sp.]|uniref:DUF411 domain-containing protein n=1 Tax=unclassified Terasakiella TaxID=2614952 RepID=UPI003B006EB7